MITFNFIDIRSHPDLQQAKIVFGIDTVSSNKSKSWGHTTTPYPVALAMLKNMGYSEGTQRELTDLATPTTAETHPDPEAWTQRIKLYKLFTERTAFSVPGEKYTTLPLSVVINELSGGIYTEECKN
jgi:hypothetical protein